jgi:uncharacterized protein YfaS (alpha-2-macroglobulin family)
VDVDFFRIKNAGLAAFLAEWNDGNNLSSWQSQSPRLAKPTIGSISRVVIFLLKPAASVSPLAARNPDQVDVDFFRIKNAGLAAFLAEWNDGNNLSSWQSIRKKSTSTWSIFSASTGNP